MTIGDAGDDFAEQVLRTSMDLAKDWIGYTLWDTFTRD